MCSGSSSLTTMVVSGTWPGPQHGDDLRRVVVDHRQGGLGRERLRVVEDGNQIGVAGHHVGADRRAERHRPVPRRPVEHVRVLPVRAGHRVEVERGFVGHELGGHARASSCARIRLTLGGERRRSIRGAHRHWPVRAVTRRPAQRLRRGAPVARPVGGGEPAEVGEPPAAGDARHAAVRGRPRRAGRHRRAAAGPGAGRPSGAYRSARRSRTAGPGCSGRRGRASSPTVQGSPGSASIRSTARWMAAGRRRGRTARPARPVRVVGRVQQRHQHAVDERADHHRLGQRARRGRR